uniref:Uncharacterized protein n=1 Tax=Oryza punctata TaxID=4537 RepID=A0A0E0LAQ3_ORYPU
MTTRMELALAVRSMMTVHSSICVWKPAGVAISGGGSEDHRSAWLLPCSLIYMVASSSTTVAVSATRFERGGSSVGDEKGGDNINVSTNAMCSLAE